MTIKYLASSLWATVFISGVVCFTSCEDDIEMKKMFEKSSYQGIYQNSAYLRDGKSNQESKVVELYSESYVASVKMCFSKAPSTTTSAKLEIDADYLKTYNELHETDFELYPDNLVTFANDGILSVNMGSRSAEIDMTITAGENLDEDKTYAIPVAITDPSSDITVKDENAKHCVYLVKDRRNMADTYKGENVVKGFLYFSTNRTNPLNTLSFQLENGKLLWDVIVLFAANINYNAEEGRPYVQCNANIQYLLDNNETLLQPLRKRGVKVLLGLLGNHDMTGLAQLSEQGAKDFAREVAQYCKVYNLDGVNYDDEYSTSPDLTNPAMAAHTKNAGARLCYETKKMMPDKLVTVYDYGYMFGVTSVDGVDVSEWIDIAVPDYGRTVTPIGNMTYKECGGLAIEFDQGRYSLTESTAQALINKGYGWYMGYAPKPEKYTQGANVFSRLQGAKTLYGSALLPPTVYYKLHDPTPYPYNEDDF